MGSTFFGRGANVTATTGMSAHIKYPRNWGMDHPEVQAAIKSYTELNINLTIDFSGNVDIFYVDGIVWTPLEGNDSAFGN